MRILLKPKKAIGKDYLVSFANKKTTNCLRVYSVDTQPKFKTGNTYYNDIQHLGMLGFYKHVL